MPILATDLKKYAAASMPENDTANSGGAIDTATVIDVTDLAANDSLEALSTNAADTMSLTVFGRNAAGAIVSETKALTGTAVISFSTLGTIERFMKAALASAAAGTVTIRRSAAGATIIALAPGKTSARRLFYDSASEVAATTRYEKEFFKNEHATLTLNNAAVKLISDPAAAIRIGVAAAVNDSLSVANRKTAPGGIAFVDDGISQSLPGGALAAGSQIGIWIEMQRGAAAAAIKNSYTTELSGTTV